MSASLFYRVVTGPNATVFSNDDCIGDQFTWEIPDGEKSIRKSLVELDADPWNEWNDRGQSAYVSPGYTLRLWPNSSE